MSLRSRRRSVFVRTGEPPPLKLTERDKKILKLVGDLKIATAAQIHRCLFYPSTLKPCTRRLQKLWLHGYLDRIFSPRLFCETYLPSAPLVLSYRLTSKGAVLISEDDNSQTVTELSKPVSYFHIKHQKEVNDFRSSLIAALTHRLGDAAGLTWVSESVLRERNIQAKRNDPTLRYAKYLVLPDALFSFNQPDGHRDFFFLELDRGTESLWRVVQKAKAYVRLNRSDLKRSLHGISSFRVLIVTSSIDRLMHLRARIASIGDCLNMFWFATVEEKKSFEEKRVGNISPERILNPIWHKITDSHLHSILRDRPTVND